MLKNDAHVKDMEAGAIAWVIDHCYAMPILDSDLESQSQPGSGDAKNGSDGSTVSPSKTTKKQTVPFFAVKVVTDIVDGDHPTQDEFIRNLQVACHTLSETLIKMVYFIENKCIHEL